MSEEPALHKENNIMQHDAEIWGILDAEEVAANERAFWMAGLPKQTGTLVRVAIAASAAVIAIRWHEKNGTLPTGCTTLWEAKQLQDELSSDLRLILTEADYKVFAQCVALIEDIPHSNTDCALCTDTPVIFTDNVSWQKLTV
jgi:hypothetical protein